MADGSLGEMDVDMELMLPPIERLSGFKGAPPAPHEQTVSVVNNLASQVNSLKTSLKPEDVVQCVTLAKELVSQAQSLLEEVEGRRIEMIRKLGGTI